MSQVAITLDYRQRLRRQARRQGSYFKNTPVHMLWVRLRKGVGFLFFFSQLLLFSEPYTANDTRHFAGFCLMLSQTGSALTFVRWLPVPYRRNSKKTALGIGLWRYVGIGIKPNDLRKMVSRRAAMSALARACLLHATGGLSHATLPPVAIGVPCPALCLR